MFDSGKIATGDTAGSNAKQKTLDYNFTKMATIISVFSDDFITVH